MPTAVLAMLTHDRTQRFTGSGGTGLGLALVKRICEYIGATLRVVTTSEAGSIVEIDCASVLHKKLTAP